MQKIFFALALAFVLAPAHAQPQQQTNDPALLRNAIGVLINQRNNALNAQVDAEARAAQLAEDNAKLKAELEELKKQKQ